MIRLLVVSLTLGVLACGSAQTGKSSRPRGDRNLVTVEELARTGPQDAYTALQSLRPHWLTQRGSSTILLRESIKVYLDGNLMGGPDQLRYITTHSINSIRYLDGIEATQRYGLDHGQGAILVFTRVGAQQ